MNSSLLRAAGEDMLVFECVRVADEGCRCLEGCHGEVLRDSVFQQGYGGLCDACMSVCLCVGTIVLVQRDWMGWVEQVWLYKIVYTVDGVFKW